MIYKKDVNFPYPLLTNTSNSYDGCNFILDVNLDENTNNYRVQIDYEIGSPFINNLLEDGQAQLILVIQSKDNKFYNLGLNEKVKEIPKNRISLSKRTTLQLLIKAKDEICFKENMDLSSFYEEFKDEIIVPKSSILVFSNSVIFEGSNAKPLELFEKKIDPNLKSDIISKLKNKGYETIECEVKIKNEETYEIEALNLNLKKIKSNNADTEEENNNEDVEKVKGVNDVNIEINGSNNKDNNIEDDNDKNNSKNNTNNKDYNSDLTVYEKNKVKEYLETTYEINKKSININ